MEAKMTSKVVETIREAITSAELKDGMAISFHHHLRNGDHVLNMVMDEVAKLGIRDLTVNVSALFDVHMPLVEHIKSGVVTTLQTDYVSRGIGTHISNGVMNNPVEFRTHGGRPADIERGVTPIDVAFVAAATSDKYGNATGRIGKSACGSLGYPVSDAACANKVVVITDNLIDGDLREMSVDSLTGELVGIMSGSPVEGKSITPTIPAEQVDYVVEVSEIGDPAGIVSGTTKITEDPTGLFMAETATKVIEASGLLRDGFSFQTGAGGASLATSKYLKEIMLRDKIKGSFALGGITSYMVDMLEAGCFEKLLDVQCFDLGAVESIKKNPNHIEISASEYASPINPDAAVNKLDVVILGATEIDTNFNVNVHTDSKGLLMGGAGGHSDASAGAKITMIITPLYRKTNPIVLDQVAYVTTPGKDIDVLVTQAGVAVNTSLEKNRELESRLKAAGVNVKSIFDLKREAEEVTGAPKKLVKGEREVAKILYRDNSEPQIIYSVETDA